MREESRGSLPLCGKLLLFDAFNNKLAESRELIADLVRVFLRWAVVTRLGLIHILELNNDDAVGWRLARGRAAPSPLGELHERGGESNPARPTYAAPICRSMVSRSKY
jgi:hypothetical protein